MLLNGPESFTPDGNFILGEAPGLRHVLRRRRIQLGRHRQLGRRRKADRRMDRRAAHRRAISPTSTSAASAPSGPTSARSPSAPARRSACTTRCAGRARSSRPRGRCGRARCTICSPRAARHSGRRTAGSARTIFAPQTQRAAPYPHTLGKPGWLADVVREQRATRRGGRALRPDLVRQAPRPGTRRARAAAAPVRQRDGRRAGPHGLHADAERARRLRERRDRHAPRRRSLPASSPARRRRRATSTGSSATSAAGEAAVADRRQRA